MRFAMFCYADESFRWTKEADDKVMEGHHATDARLAAAGKLGPSLRLMPTTTAMTIHAGQEPLVTDGPFAETKEVLLGFWVLEADTLEGALTIGREYASHMPGGKLELRPVMTFDPGNFPA